MTASNIIDLPVPFSAAYLLAPPEISGKSDPTYDQALIRFPPARL
jgi:hypothetical protein